MIIEGVNIAKGHSFNTCIYKTLSNAV